MEAHILAIRVSYHSTTSPPREESQTSIASLQIDHASDKKPYWLFLVYHHFQIKIATCFRPNLCLFSFTPEKHINAYNQIILYISGIVYF